MPEPTLLLDARAILMESPVWDAASSELLWCDITLGLLHRTSEDGSADRQSELPPPLASFQPRRGGGLIAALGDRVVETDDEGRILRDLASIGHRHPGMRLNEGKCDPFGNFVVGAMEVTTEDPDAGLYRVTPAGDVAVLKGGFGTTNGIEFTDDGSTMWVTDTAVQTIFRGSYGADGLLGELEPFAVGHAFDGLVRDSRGEFWSAVYGAGVVVHLSAEGEELETIEVPAPNVTGITIGGSDLSTLYVGSARENATEEQLREFPLSGGVFAIELDRPGLPPRLFG
jgi:sugar lactone lactonase YvrE